MQSSFRCECKSSNEVDSTLLGDKTPPEYNAKKGATCWPNEWYVCVGGSGGGSSGGDPTQSNENIIGQNTNDQ